MHTEARGKILAYIDHHPVATLGTINADGSPQGAIVYVCADKYQVTVYFVTKQETTKYQNLRDRNQVSITIADPANNSTLQANGTAFIVDDPRVIDMVLEKITREHASSADWLPPIAKLRAGAYDIVGVKLTYARLAQFHGMAIGDEDIFTGGEVNASL